MAFDRPGRTAGLVNVDAVVAALDAELRAAGTPDRAENEKRYLKSDLEFYGATVPAIRKVVKAFLRGAPDLDRERLLAIAAQLWSAPVHERRMAAVELLCQREPLLEPADAAFIEQLIRESKTWALVDPLAATAAGRLLERHPQAAAVLDGWAADDDFWVRRSALLAHLRGLSSGAGDFERFGRYADAMLDGKEFFIRKAIGWVLRDMARKRPDVVYEWIAPRTHRASGVTVREVVKRLAPDQAERVLTAYRERRPVE